MYRVCEGCGGWVICSAYDLIDGLVQDYNNPIANALHGVTAVLR